MEGFLACWIGTVTALLFFWSIKAYISGCCDPEDPEPEPAVPPLPPKPEPKPYRMMKTQPIGKPRATYGEVWIGNEDVSRAIEAFTISIQYKLMSMIDGINEKETQEEQEAEI